MQFLERLLRSDISLVSPRGIRLRRGEGGDTPHDGVYGEAPGYLFQASGILKGNLSLGSVKGLIDEIYGFKKKKSRKRSIFVIDSHIKDSSFTAVKRVAKF